MKNRLYILITIILAAFVCFSCKSELDKPGKENAAKQGIKINVMIPSLDKNILNERKAYITDDTIINSYKYTLTAENKDTESEVVTLFAKKTYKEFMAEECEIQPGNWDFTLKALSFETEEVYLTGTDSAEITPDNTSLNFVMSYVEGSTGNFAFKISAASSKEPKIVIKSFDSLSETYLEYADGDDNDNVTMTPEVSTDGGTSKNDYSIKLATGKYIIFIYPPVQSADGTYTYKDVPDVNEIVYVYGGLTTEKDYTATSIEGIQDIEVELVVGTDYTEELSAGFNVNGSASLSEIHYNYTYDSETGTLVYKHVGLTTDLLLPKITLSNAYLTGWYTDEDLTEEADYIRCEKCNNSADSLAEVLYFRKDLSYVAGKLKVKLYAKFAPRYSIQVETNGGPFEYKGSFGTLVNPEEGETVYTINNCAYETKLSELSIDNKRDGEGSVSSVFIGWYYDAEHTKRATGFINSDFTGKDSDGNPLKLYAYYIDTSAVMNVKFIGYNSNTGEDDADIASSFQENSYNKKVQMDASGSFSAYILKSQSSKVPEKPGYAFVGWYSDPDFENPVPLGGYYKDQYTIQFGFDDFVPDGDIYFYAKYEPLVSPSLSISVQSYEENDLKLSYELNDGVLTVTASPKTAGTTYKGYTWAVNGNILNDENESVLNYTLYTTQAGDQTPVYTSGSTILISCIAQRDDDDYDSDDANLDLLLNINAEIEAVIDTNYTYTENGYKMSYGTFNKNEGGTYVPYYLLSILNSDDTAFNDPNYSYMWYKDGVLLDSGEWYVFETSGSTFTISDDEDVFGYRIGLKSTDFTGEVLITCIMVNNETYETYDASYSLRLE